MDARAVSAARYWASRPGNQAVFAVFDAEDARQEAAILAWRNPDDEWGVIYKRLLTRVQQTIRGYKKHKLPHTVTLDDDDRVTDCTAERLTLLHQRLTLLDRLPPLQHAIVEHWLDGDDDKQAGAAHGMTGAGWRWHRKRLFDSLQRKGL